MTKNIRSLIGAMLMLMIIPMVAGLLACMPVPIGDPDRSRIDPDLTGPWIMDTGGEFNLYLFQPYDRRTWLVVGAQFEEGSEAEFDGLDLESADDVLAALRTYPIGEDGITSKTTILFKAWLTKLGGEQFMTWEPLGGIRDDGSLTAQYWFVFKVVKEESDRVGLYLMDPGFEGFADITKPDEYEGDDYPGAMRRTWERAIRKHIEDNEIYEEQWTLHRVPPNDVESAAELLEEVIGGLL